MESWLCLWVNKKQAHAYLFFLNRSIFPLFGRYAKVKLLGIVAAVVVTGPITFLSYNQQRQRLALKVCELSTKIEKKDRTNLPGNLLLLLSTIK